MASRALSCANGMRLVRRLAIGAIPAVIAGAVSSPVFAATIVNRVTYSSNTTWGAAGSPYIINGDVTVGAAATLTINPGVVVKMNGSGRLIIVDGAIQADGTSTNRVTFTSIQDDAADGQDSGGDGATTGTPGQWARIWIRSSGSSSRFVNTDIRNGGSGSANWSQGAVRLSSGTITVSYSTFTYNQRSGLIIVGGPAGNYPGAEIDHSNFDHNGNGITVTEGWIDLQSNSSARFNSEDGVRITLSGGETSEYDGPQPAVRNSEIKANGRYGVYLIVAPQVDAESYPHGTQNNIFDNGELDLQPSSYRPDADWHGNYWGPDAEWRANDPKCRLVLPFSAGHLTLDGAGYPPGSSIPDGPIESGRYLVPDPPNDPIECAFDLVLTYDIFGEPTHETDYIDNSGL